MPLAAGTRLGPYEIVAPVGAGGMGEVYQARDPRLNRIVAIKVAKEQFSERFEREAKAVAALNHPNICQIYDVGPDYLVMEFVEGQALRGPMQLEEALRLVGQIADALEAAHEKGIVHRDLKPANILLKPDGSVKVLDFGLAKLGAATPASGGDPEASPTLSMAATQAGVILGTAAYMSPEQARGKTATARADVWAFGVVLYEMLTGRRLFDGEDLTEILAAVVKEQPDLGPAPYEVRRLLEACLQKDPKKRLQAIGDWKLLLDRPQAAPPVAAAGRTRAPWLWPALAGALAVSTVLLALVHFREASPTAEVLRFTVNLPGDTGPAYLAFSPDGRRMAVVTSVQGKGGIYLRTMDSTEFHLLEGTNGARTPFWSPDSRFIGFFADGTLKVIPAAGGPATILCGDTGPGTGGAWSRAGVILFGSEDKLRRVNAAGGACTPLNLGDKEWRGGGPEFLPDGNHYLFAGGKLADPSSAGLYLTSLDGMKPRKILNDFTTALYAPAASAKGPGHLLFLRGTNLMAQAFDPQKLEAMGDPSPVASPASRSASPPQLAASLASNGTLAYVAGRARQQQLTWFDRSGKELGKVGEAAERYGVSLSPDGTRAALTELNPSDPLGFLRIFDLVRNSDSRFTPSGKSAGGAVWSFDGTQVVYFDGAQPTLFVRPVGTDQETRLLPPDGNTRTVSDWSRDGKFLIYTEVDPKTQGDIWYLPDPGKPESKPVRLIATTGTDSQGQLSPDGQWLAYFSNEGGSSSVYIRHFPSGDRATKVADSATQPRWSNSGSELFYLGRAQAAGKVALMSLTFQTGAGGLPKLGVPQKIVEFSAITVIPQNNFFNYSPHPDGKRFLVNVNAGEQRPEINVITHWEKLLPGPSGL